MGTTVSRPTSHDVRKNDTLSKHKNADNYPNEINSSDDEDEYFTKHNNNDYYNGSEYRPSVIGPSSSVKVEIIQNNEIVHNHLVKNYNMFFDDITAVYPDVKISMRSNSNNIKLTGEHDYVDQVKNEILKLTKTLSNKIFTFSYEMKPSEYSFLFSQSEFLTNLQATHNCMLSQGVYEKYASFKLKDNVEVILCSGDMLKLNVDAYVNPVNTKINTSDGLAKAIFDRAGVSVKEKCISFINQNTNFNEGHIFVTDSGDLGIKNKSIIIHAAGPVWKGGKHNEAAKLSQVIESCLFEANAHCCSSIIIPAVSTGIFQYDAYEATKLISEKVIKFIQKPKFESTLKTIIFISNQNHTAATWETSLSSVSIKNKINIKTASGISQSPKDKWYWKDEEGNWKPYLNRYSEYIKSNYEKKNYSFLMQINDRNYTILMYKPNAYSKDSFVQVNCQTKNVHEITNTLPDIPIYQWYWLDDNNHKSPYSIKHSNEIEESYKKSNCLFVKIEIKRHPDDLNCNYLISFCDRNEDARNQAKNTHANAIQKNAKTGYIRHVFREEHKCKAEIIFDENNVQEEEEEEYVRKRTHIVFINGFQAEIQDSIKTIGKYFEKSRKNEILPFFDLSTDDVNRMEYKYDVKITVKNNQIVVYGFKDSVDKIKLEILNLIAKTHKINPSILSKVHYPSTWTVTKQNENFLMCDVAKGSDEYKKIQQEIARTVPSFEIKNIERIQNKGLWKKFQMHKDWLKNEKHVNENEEFLFYGCRSTRPELIYNSENGFDMRHSNSGMWGQGIYFARNAIYSKSGYEFNNGDGTHSIFYARVALGDYVLANPDSTLTLPPEKPVSGHKMFTVMRYDSVKGVTGGSGDVFIIYENGRAYPEYLITFTR